ncbi:hypothetical protein [Chryseobacterium limigenitum]|uniref:Uncharacterized protein n=1 Tax=Chryseobacterium limigenitum TaxID=1612149 RepID=A0A1K2IUP6_9FLAO|nr:hypothetical protein [Chryseobacterium limigenitum]SFZ96087.1 hypothetical protein SAMN05216324_11583 [Chryseobacterium limigenitum]
MDLDTYIKYTDENNNETSQKQLDQFSEFNRLTYDSTTHELKKIERFSKNYRTKEVEQLGGEVYLSPEDILPEVITNHIDIGSFGKPWTFHYNKKANDKGETQWDSILYRNGSLHGKAISIFDERNRKLAGCSIDLLTGNKTDKFKNFYGDPSIFEYEFENETIPTIKFTYNEDGRVDEIFFQDDEFSVRDFLDNDEITAKFPWKENVYYHAFEPMLSLI